MESTWQSSIPFWLHALTMGAVIFSSASFAIKTTKAQPLSNALVVWRVPTTLFCACCSSSRVKKPPPHRHKSLKVSPQKGHSDILSPPSTIVNSVIAPARAFSRVFLINNRRHLFFLFFQLVFVQAFVFRFAWIIMPLRARVQVFLSFFFIFQGSVLRGLPVPALK